MVQQADRSRLFTWLRFYLFLFLSLFIWQSSVQPAKAADTWTVCQSGGCDFSSIQTAISSSSVTNDDIISFPVNKETYNERITLSKSLTFVGQTTTINAQNGGTAVTITGSPTVVMQNMIIQNGMVSNGNGGGIRLGDGDLTLTNVTLSSNDVTGNGTSNGLGGGLYIASNSSEVQLTDVTIQTGTAESGGAIYNNGTLTASTLTFTDNDATKGGGIYNNGAATLDDQSAAQRNNASESGGGFFNESGAMLTLLNCGLSNNDAVNGAGIYNKGTLQLTNTNVGSGNVATQAGGGLYNLAQAALTNSAVVQNQADTGAGVYNQGTLTANNSTFSRNAGPSNQANANGPGLYNQSGTAVLSNVTIHLTIGTSIFANGGTVTVGNSIISSAPGTSGLTACSGGGAFVSNGYNLANDQSCTFLTGTGDIQGVSPDLNAITSPANGAAYHSPKLTSPVINAGNPAEPGSGGTACLASDQRGLERPQNMRCDIGAVEITVYRLYTPLVIK